MNSDQFGKIDKPEELSAEDSEAGEPEVLVRRSDEDLALFDSERIVQALVREASLDHELASHISTQVRESIQKYGLRTLSSSLIRGLVDAKLLELGLEDAHRAHSRLGVPFYDVDRLMHSTFRESVSQPFGPDGTSLVLAEAIKREYSILNVFSDQTANAHLVGDIHIHRIGAIDRPHSVVSAVDYVKRFGVALPHGFVSSRPARHGDVLMAHIVKLSAALQGYLAGPVAWDSLNYSVAPFLTGLDSKAIKQLAQALIFELATPAVARGGQVVLADIHLDWVAPPYMRHRPAIGPGGDLTEIPYAEYTNEGREMLLALLEVCLEGDANGRPFLTPRLVLHVTPDFENSAGSRDVLERAAGLANDRGGFAIRFDRTEARAFYARYGIADEQAFGGIDSHGWRSSQFQVVTLNLPRVGYLAGGNQLKVFEELTRLMEVAALAHLEKHVFLEKLLALGEKGPLSALTTRVGGTPFLRLNWTTHGIGVVGLNELCRAVLDSDLHESVAAMEFARKVLLHLKHEAERLSGKHRVRFILTGEPTDSAAQRLARLDLRFFGQTAGSVLRSDDPATAYYTDGPRLPAWSGVSALDRVRHEGMFHETQMLNVATEVWSREPLTVGDFEELVLSALNKSSGAGLVFCPEFTVCFECGRQSRGLKDRCESCAAERVDGLAYTGDRYSYTSSWDRARLAELHDRLRPFQP